MNSTFYTKIIVQTIRRQCCRHLSVQQNINKTHCTINFQYKNEHKSSCLNFLSLSRKILSPRQPLLYMNFQRTMASEMTVVNHISESVTSGAAESTVESGLFTEFLDTFSQNMIVKYSEGLLLDIHELTGLPWWSSLALSAFFVRITTTLPLSVYQTIVMHKLEIISLRLDNLEKQVQLKINETHGHYGWPEKVVKEKVMEEVKKGWSELTMKEKCQPICLGYLVLFQSTAWISFTLATRNLCNTALHPDMNTEEVYTQILNGGVAWITNLTEVDPYFVLPVSWVLLNLSILQVHKSLNPNSAIIDNWFCHVMKAVSIGLLPIAINMPAATSIYCLSSSLYGLLQAFILNFSPILRLLKVSRSNKELPMLSVESELYLEQREKNWKGAKQM